MLSFLGLSGADDILRRVELDSFRGHGTTSSPAASVGRWVGELAAADRQVIEAACGELMARYGYATE